MSILQKVLLSITVAAALLFHGFPKYPVYTTPLRILLLALKQLN